MHQDGHGTHHNHAKRGHSVKNTCKTVLDKFIYVVVFVGPVLTIPQVTKIWVEQNASGVSVISWFTYFITACFWLAYGIFHKEKPIIISSAIWMFLDILIVVGAVLYG